MKSLSDLEDLISDTEKDSTPSTGN